MKDTETAGPIWIGQLFTWEIYKTDDSRSENSQWINLAQNPSTADLSLSSLIYYMLDEIAKKSKTAPPKLADAIGMYKILVMLQAQNLILQV